MAPRTSAGILLYRRDPSLEILIGRMGGPFWARKRSQNWSVPKGEYQPDETPLQAACREFTEELGLAVPDVPLVDLGSIKQSGGKQVQVFAGESTLELSGVTLGTFELEWPRGSGTMQQFPELAEVAWSSVSDARTRLVAAQVTFLDRLLALVESDARE